MAAQGYHILSEQLEADTTRVGSNAAFLPYVCLRVSSWKNARLVVVTYGREVAPCPNCGAEVVAGYQCSNCLRALLMEQHRRACEQHR